MGFDVLEHESNKGKGAALKSGFAHALSHYPDAVGIITADADGQHAPQDILRLARLLEEGADGIVLGVRAFDDRWVPFKSKWGNRITSGVFWLKTGLRINDTQTGLRAIPMRFVAGVSRIKGARFEYETNMLLQASRMNIALIAAPIDTIYQNGNKSSHFRAVRDSARIYWDIVKFGSSSGLCAAVDFGLFVLLSGTVTGQDATGIAVSVILARIVSGTINFLLNRFVVFQSKSKAAVYKYFILFAAQMLLSARFTALLARGMLLAPMAKLVVDAALFFLSFIIQRTFIFRKDGINDKNAKKL